MSSEARRFIPQNERTPLKPTRKENYKLENNETLLDEFTMTEREAIVEQAIEDTNKAIAEMEKGDKQNFGTLINMRKIVEKGITDNVRTNQKEEMRKIMIDNRIAELAAERSKKKVEKIEINDTEVDDMLENLGM